MLYFGIPKYLEECLKDQYQNQTAEVETAVGRTGPLSVQRGCPSRLPTFTNAVQHVQRTYYKTCPGEMGRWH